MKEQELLERISKTNRVVNIVLYAVLACWALLLGFEIGQKEWFRALTPITSIVCWVLWFKIWKDSQKQLKENIIHQYRIMELEEEIADLMGTKNNDAAK